MEGGEYPKFNPKKTQRGAQNKVTGRKKPEFSPAPQPEKAEELEKFIRQGLELIKLGQYLGAVRYFDNTEEAEKLDIYYAPDKTIHFFIRKFPIPTSKVPEILHEWAKHNYFYNPKREGEKPAIELSQILYINPKDPEGSFSLADDNLPEDLTSQIPTSLSHNMALAYAEEWLHALQFFRGDAPLAGYKNGEIDVAVYLLNQGVPLTDEFLARHQRRQVLFEGKPPPTIPIA